MATKLKIVAVCYGHKIYYESNIYEQYIVLWPKWNGTSELHRFESEEQARDFIEENVPESWFMSHLS